MSHSVHPLRHVVSRKLSPEPLCAGKYTGVSAADMARGGSGFGGGGGYSGGGGGYGGYGSGSGYGSGGDLGSYGGGGGSGGHSRTGSGNVGGYGGLQSPGGAREGGAGGSGGNSFHARSGSGSMHGMGSSAGAQEVEDPFEATRRRIERLKADGSLGSPGGEGGSSSAAAAAAGPAPLIPSSINMDASANLFPGGRGGAWARAGAQGGVGPTCGLRMWDGARLGRCSAGGAWKVVPTCGSGSGGCVLRHTGPVNMHLLQLVFMHCRAEGAAGA